MIWSKSCARCETGDMTLDEDGDKLCMQCGYTERLATAQMAAGDFDDLLRMLEAEAEAEAEPAGSGATAMAIVMKTALPRGFRKGASPVRRGLGDPQENTIWAVGDSR